jgi:hypothetical protein
MGVADKQYSFASVQWAGALEAARSRAPRSYRAKALQAVMDAKGAPMHALKVNDKYAILRDLREIGWALATRHGGVGPHP